MGHVKKIIGLGIFLLATILTSCTTSVAFTINFDTNGGTDVADIVTDGDSIITISDDPVKEGFFFGGWYWDNNTFSQPFTANSLLDSPLSSNMTVYAKWNEDDNYIPPGFIQVTFDSNGGTVLDPANVLIGHTIAIPVVTKDGYTLDGWYTSINGGATLDEKWSLTTSEVINNFTLYAKWNINTYTITYHLNDGTNNDSNLDAFTFETEIISLEDPIKEGYSFLGWYQHEDFTGDVITEIAPQSYEDYELYAKWEINEYTLTFNSNEGSLINPITQDYNTTVVEPSNPTREGYTFGGWYSDVNLTATHVFTFMPAENITLYAKWEINEYTLTFDSNEGTSINPIVQDYNTIIIEPLEPIRAGYTFIWWYTDTNLTADYTFTNMPSEDLILYAKWNLNYYQIVYELNDGINNINNPNSYTIETEPILLQDPEKEGNTFLGWYEAEDFSGSEITSIISGSVDHMSLYTKWEINQYTLTFESNEGSLIDPIVQDYNTAVIEPSGSVRIGYTFSGWYKDINLTIRYTFTNMPSEDLMLYAKWNINYYQIVYELNDGVENLNNPNLYTIETETILLEASEKVGYTFLGWFEAEDFSGSEITSIISGSVGHLLFYAKWAIN